MPERNALVFRDVVRVTNLPGSLCTSLGRTAVECSGRVVLVDLGDGDDIFRTSAGQKTTVLGGPGADSYDYVERPGASTSCSREGRESTTGKSISLDSHQTLTFADGIATLTGQGPNVRAPGLGLIYQDVGRLVTDVTVPYPGETLFASAKSVSFAAFDPDKLAAAICTAVG